MNNDYKTPIFKVCYLENNDIVTTSGPSAGEAIAFDGTWNTNPWGGVDE